MKYACVFLKLTTRNIRTVRFQFCSQNGKQTGRINRRELKFSDFTFYARNQISSFYLGSHLWCGFWLCCVISHLSHCVFSTQPCLGPTKLYPDSWHLYSLLSLSEIYFFHLPNFLFHLTISFYRSLDVWLGQLPLYSSWGMYSRSVLPQWLVFFDDHTHVCNNLTQSLTRLPTSWKSIYLWDLTQWLAHSRWSANIC